MIIINKMKIINNIEFKNNKILHLYTTTMLKQRIGQSFLPEDEEFRFLLGLFKYHPTKTDIDYITKIDVIKNIGGHPHLLIHRPEYEMEDISFIQCIKGKDPSIDTLQKKAFRYIISPQIIDFKKCNPKCVLCNSTTDIEIDHVAPTFIELFNEFKKTNTIPKEFIQDLYFITLPDGEVKSRWYEFHLQKAVLQSLCKKCHKEKTFN